VNDFSDMANRAGVLDRTNVDDLSDSLPLQDFTASMLMLEERFSNLEVCVCVCVLEARVPRGAACLSAARRLSHAGHDVKWARGPRAGSGRPPPWRGQCVSPGPAAPDTVCHIGAAG
jgi:hypothetical protein